MKILEVSSSILDRRKCTVGVCREFLIELRDFFEFLLDHLHDPVQHVRLYFLDFLAIDLVDDLVYFLQSLPELGVEVVLDAVVGPEWVGGYLDSSLEPMMAHLLPSSLCKSNSLC